ncbi:cyclohexadienyl dehydratase [Mycolicibacterium sp. BK556]|uniref:transporter substrate-binding domain-containing protein n=1 Tax=unclassified Mycolicibacterium TaxID=2636767 RepID=UPI0016148FB6|nr:MULTISPECIES: transporter substrate-binding domain-containing protein [unclassified Mycolicibacterium]MBB3603853.1 cyclohexadienyl dehydratase [Mycolicibacterium sp. BK556]MBB3634048.1 cyclohexadienyl dehydratase [Mycolicibacterium sp. BK607]MBB3751629.1 cyclohexadienyl dehydratase [Mycolicibacterium sp. BK634]
MDRGCTNRMWPLSFGAAAFAATIAASGLAVPPALAGGDPATLKICTTGDYPPLTYRDPATGQYSGVDIDMANDLAAHLGRAPMFVPTTWSTLMADLTSPGTCDIAMGGITDTAQRRLVADVTKPYLSSGKTPMVAAANAGRLSSIEDIDQPGVRVIENSGGTNEQFARQHFPNAALTIWPDNTTIFDQLAAGYADVMVTDAVEAIYQSDLHPGLVAQHPEQPFTSEVKAYLLPKGSPIAGQTDAWLADALGDGTFAGIYQRWLHAPAPEAPA